MARGKRTQAPELEVHLLRQGLVESTHWAQVSVCDERGHVLSVAGSSDAGAFIRSALKPFQALAVATSATLEHYHLTDKDLAIICSSHQGNVEQARQVFNILWRADIDPAELQCPIPPVKRSPLQHNCSGKHAGMLALCQHYGWSLNTYLRYTSSVQKLILSKVSELLQMPAEELVGVRDDCGAPTYSMQLAQMATLFAKLASGNNLNLERIVRAMTHYPTMVAGEERFDTELMRLTAGELVSKSGAEGVQCVGRIGEGMGLAIKVSDGAKRAKYAVAIEILKQMGWISPTVSETLSERFMSLSEHKRLEVTGELTLL